MEHSAPLEESQTNNLFNDGKCDRAGNFWFGSKHEKDKKPTGSLYRLDKYGKVIKLLDGIMTSNGIGWSPDNATIYYTDSGKKREFTHLRLTEKRLLTNKSSQRTPTAPASD